MTEPSSSAGAPSLLLLTHFTPLCVLREALAGAVFPSRFTREVPGRAGPSPKASTPCPLPAGSPAHKGTLSRLNEERRCDAEAAKCSRQVQGSLPNRRAARRLGEKPPAAGNVHAAAACPLPGGTEPPHTPPGGKKGSLQPPGLVWREKSHGPNGTRGREESLWGGGKPCRLSADTSRACQRVPKPNAGYFCRRIPRSSFWVCSIFPIRDF